MTASLDPVQGVLGEPPAPPPEVWTLVLARALDPAAPAIDAVGLVPDPEEFFVNDPETEDLDGFGRDAAEHHDPAGQDDPGQHHPGPAAAHHDDPGHWSEPSGRLTGHEPDDHDGADLPPSEDPWSPGPEAEMY
ncbi:hypothetical protein [Krasilnikovia sp. MM14-A1004]|uniref:hypothetical protein n=1 Tax=Krasilnikovia sp. MM14-A1004 TaxID=3373541 RepID=UPI00399C6935